MGSTYKLLTNISFTSRSWEHVGLTAIQSTCI